MSTKFTTTKPFILMMYGFPGSGKTTFARQLADDLGAVHLQEDKIRDDLFGDTPADSNQEAWLRTIMDYMALELLNTGVSVVYDALVLTAAERRRVRELAQASKTASILVWLQIDPETSYMRTQKRDRRKTDDRYALSYDEESYRAVLASMQNPNNEDYTVISGKHTFHTQRAAVTKKLYDIGVVSPELHSQNITKPGLVNLVPQIPKGRGGDMPRRNVHIR
jgi:predicted kinase